jgi:thiamine-monophosphate kinase
LDEFEALDRLLRPLAAGAPEALDLRDDAALVAMRPGFELVVTQDALVEGRHFLEGARPEDVAARLLRTNLSDLAAKAAEPFGYFLTLCWPKAWTEDRRTLFAAALGREQTLFGVKLFGGDTVATDGPLVVSATLLGWAPSGAMVRRAGARAGDLLLVSGAIGDAALGLRALTGALDPGPDREALEARFHRPAPRLELRGLLRRLARAAADVSDGLLADAGAVAAASGVGVEIDLDRMPLSPEGRRWAERQADLGAALADLASAGDDYEIVLAVEPGAAAEASRGAGGTPLTVVGRFTEKRGVAVRLDGAVVQTPRLGWRHL